MVSLPAVTSWTKKLANSTSVMGPCPKSPARISEVRSSRGGSWRRCGGQLHGVHGHAGHAPRRVGWRRARGPGCSCSPRPSGRICSPSSGGRPIRLADDLVGQHGRHVVDELDVAVGGDLIEDGTADRADLAPPSRRSPCLEAAHQGPTVVGVAGRVHHQHHVAAQRELLGLWVLEHHAHLLGGEDRRVLGHGAQVGVAQHRPVARLVRHLLPVHGLGASQLGEDLVDRPVDVEVRVVDVDLGGRHSCPPGVRCCPRWCQRPLREASGRRGRRTVPTKRFCCWEQRGRRLRASAPGGGTDDDADGT